MTRVVWRLVSTCGAVPTADAVDWGAGDRLARTPAGLSRLNRELKRRVRLLEQDNEVLRRAAAYLGQANLPKG